MRIFWKKKNNYSQQKNKTIMISCQNCRLKRNENVKHRCSNASITSIMFLYDVCIFCFNSFMILYEIKVCFKFILNNFSLFWSTLLFTKMSSYYYNYSSIVTIDILLVITFMIHKYAFFLVLVIFLASNTGLLTIYLY